MGAGRAIAMTVLIYLVPMALLLGLTGLAAFLWSLRSGQYDDVEGAAVRILDDDDIEAQQRGAVRGPRQRTPEMHLPADMTAPSRIEAVSRHTEIKRPTAEGTFDRWPQ